LLGKSLLTKVLAGFQSVIYFQNFVLKPCN
jgi:hypothetical protein